MTRNTIMGLTALASALLANACASVDRAPDEPVRAPTPEATPTILPHDVPETTETSSEGRSAAEVTIALERALADGWRELGIAAECVVDDGYESVEIFGSGVAIWGKKTQFTLTHDEIRQQLEAFREAGFADLAPRYGGRTATDLKPPAATGGASKNATRITCRVSLELDGVSKQVTQIHRGEQSPELRWLAEQILDGCRESARQGIAAASLDDGLAKAATAVLAPETLEIIFHRKPARGEADEGWLLRLQGREASSRTFRPGDGYGDVHLLELEPADFEELAGLLAEQGPEGLPGNLYAEHYTDLKLSVLGHKKSLQGRQFADMTPTQHGELQRRFDRIVVALQDLHRRVMAQGHPGTEDRALPEHEKRPAPGAGPLQAEARTRYLLLPVSLKAQTRVLKSKLPLFS